MPVDPTLARLSDSLFALATVGYALAMLVLTAEFAFARRRAPRPVAALAGAARGGGVAVAAPPPLPAPAPPLASASGRTGLALVGLAWALHVGSVLARGLAAGRFPWGNMYEFASAMALLAVSAYLVLARQPALRRLGGFVLLPVVLLLGLAGTVLYVPAGPLQPALNSYWLAIHVAAAIVASGGFTVATVLTVLYLLRSRDDLAREQGGAGARRGLARRLPPPETLDRATLRVIAFAFPVWTFAIVAGAIWAEAAWGRYWGWDPKETWSFISWIVYAGYLHARTTAGWRGRRAAAVALAGFAALVFNFFGVNMLITGLHSYAGL